MDGDNGEPAAVSRWKRWRRHLLILLACLLGVYLAGEFVYMYVVARRVETWETQVERNGDGVRIGCEAFSAGQGQTALLMVHGFADSPAAFRNVAPALAARGFTCRAMRLPGFAEPMDVYRHTDLDQWADALGRELDVLKAAHSSVWLVGHSMGAALIVRHLAERPGSADGVVLICPLFAISNRRSPILPSRTWFALGDFYFTHAAVIQVWTLDRTSSANDAQNLRDAFVPGKVYREMFKLIDSVRDSGIAFALPMLMLVSGEDRVIHTPAAERFFHNAQVSRKQIRTIPAARHTVLTDEQWPRVVDAIATFIGEHGEQTREVSNADGGSEG